MSSILTQSKIRYDRILRRISQGLSSLEQGQARAILEWVSCSIVPITQKEIQVALSVARGKDPFRGSKELLLDVVQRCGPIIEVINDNVYFVHFSAKEQVLPNEKYRKSLLIDVQVSVQLPKQSISQDFRC